MTTKIKWRLGTLPTPEEVRGLISDKIITKEEGREILFNQVEDGARDVKSLESEITFLRELVELLSKDKTKIIETIRIISPSYISYPWYQPYQSWTNGFYVTGTAGTVGNSNITLSALNGSASTQTNSLAIASSQVSGAGSAAVNSFSDIKTF